MYWGRQLQLTSAETFQIHLPHTWKSQFCHAKVTSVTCEFSLDFACRETMNHSPVCREYLCFSLKFPNQFMRRKMKKKKVKRIFFVSTVTESFNTVTFGTIIWVNLSDIEQYWSSYLLHEAIYSSWLLSFLSDQDKLGYVGYQNDHHHSGTKTWTDHVNGRYWKLLI